MSVAFRGRGWFHRSNTMIPNLNTCEWNAHSLSLSFFECGKMEIGFVWLFDSIRRQKQKQSACHLPDCERNRVLIVCDKKRSELTKKKTTWMVLQFGTPHSKCPTIQTRFLKVCKYSVLEWYGLEKQISILHSIELMCCWFFFYFFFSNVRVFMCACVSNLFSLCLHHLHDCWSW